MAQALIQKISPGRGTTNLSIVTIVPNPEGDNYVQFRVKLCNGNVRLCLVKPPVLSRLDKVPCVHRPPCIARAKDALLLIALAGAVKVIRMSRIHSVFEK